MRIFYLPKLAKNIIYSLYETIIEAVFPLSEHEKWLIDNDISAICKSLSRAKYSPIPEAFSIYSYKDERVHNLIWSIKYKKSFRAAKVAGSALFRYIEMFSYLLPNIIIIPMPISKQRRRERGFNQCELILNEIKKINHYENISFMDDLLIRSHHTSRQTLKDREHRIDSAQGLYSINTKRTDLLSIDFPEISKYLFIIIDDVITTGSTMKEAVSTMRNAGFTNTWGLSIAH